MIVTGATMITVHFKFSKDRESELDDTEIFYYFNITFSNQQQ